MNKHITVRHPVPRDVQACSLVEQACFPAEEAASRDSIAKRIAVFPQGFLVARLQSGDRVVGQINSGATNKDDITDEAFKQLIGHEDGGRNLVIFSLSVLPEFQGRGIATRLMLGFLDLARTQARQSVLLLCKEDLLDFYRRFGFANRGVSASVHGGARWFEMACPLS